MLALGPKAAANVMFACVLGAGLLFVWLGTGIKEYRLQVYAGSVTLRIPNEYVEFATVENGVTEGIYLALNYTDGSPLRDSRDKDFFSVQILSNRTGVSPSELFAGTRRKYYDELFDKNGVRTYVPNSETFSGRVKDSFRVFQKDGDREILVHCSGTDPYCRWYDETPNGLALKYLMSRDELGDWVRASDRIRQMVTRFVVE